MLNLVEGERAVLVSEENAFAPFEVRYAETCVVPQAAGAYRVSSPEGKGIRVILACVRP